MPGVKDIAWYVGFAIVVVVASISLYEFATVSPVVITAKTWVESFNEAFSSLMTVIERAVFLMVALYAGGTLMKRSKRNQGDSK